MNKAVLRFSPQEYEYQNRFGIMPDYDFIRMMKNGMTAETAGNLIGNRMNEIWEDFKRKDAEEKNLSYFREITVRDYCPF